MEYKLVCGCGVNKELNEVFPHIDDGLIDMLLLWVDITCKHCGENIRIAEINKNGVIECLA